MQFLCTLSTLCRALLTIALLSSTFASAQTTYRWIDSSTGRTVISDMPPPPGARQVVKQAGEDSSTQQGSYATRQAAEKYPVTLYTSANCTDGCKQARELLNGRGIPFSEKMLNTQEDIDQLNKKLGGEASVPSVIIGRQNIQGFESGAWNNLLDLAGYPKSAPFGTKPSGIFSQ